jgi:hypothetical protein
LYSFIKETMRTIRTIILFSFLSLAAHADISGTVTNKTTGKPAAGDEVTLLKLSGTMVESGHVKTDVQGRFLLKTDDAAANYLVRVTHDGVNYHHPAPPGTNNLEMDVFDASAKIDGVHVSVEVMRIESDSTGMHVTHMFSVQNESKPQRTQNAEKNFEIILPAGAKIQEGLAAGPGGMPISAVPQPTGTADHYSFNFPIRPGESRFQVDYILPYNGSAGFNPRLTHAADNFGVSVAKGITLLPSSGSKLNLRGEEAGMTVFVASKVAPGTNVGFTIKGTGVAPADNNDAGANGGTNAGGAPADSGAAGQPGSPEGTGRPGGGMANPVNTANPVSKYEWIILAVVGLAMVAGAAWSMGRPVTQAGQTVVAANVSGTMLENLKEEMFKLESERLHEKITPEEYQRVKTALDVLLMRVMKK